MDAAMRILAFALFLPSRLPPPHAKDTGLIFVSNEKTNNIIVIDPKTYKVIEPFPWRRRRARNSPPPSAPRCGWRTVPATPARRFRRPRQPPSRRGTAGSGVVGHRPQLVGHRRTWVSGA